MGYQDTQFTTHFSSSSDLLRSSALARAMAPVPVRPLALRSQYKTHVNKLELDLH